MHIAALLLALLCLAASTDAVRFGRKRKPNEPPRLAPIDPARLQPPSSTPAFREQLVGSNPSDEQRAEHVLNYAHALVFAVAQQPNPVHALMSLRLQDASPPLRVSGEHPVIPPAGTRDFEWLTAELRDLLPPGHNPQQQQLPHRPFLVWLDNMLKNIREYAGMTAPGELRALLQHRARILVSWLALWLPHWRNALAPINPLVPEPHVYVPVHAEIAQPLFELIEALCSGQVRSEHLGAVLNDAVASAHVMERNPFLRLSGLRISSFTLFQDVQRALGELKGAFRADKRVAKQSVQNMCRGGGGVSILLYLWEDALSATHTSVKRVGAVAQ